MAADEQKKDVLSMLHQVMMFVSVRLGMLEKKGKKSDRWSVVGGVLAVIVSDRWSVVGGVPVMTVLK